MRCLFFSSWGCKEIEGAWNPVPHYDLQKLVPGDLLPAARPRLLLMAQLPKTLQPAGDRGGDMGVCGCRAQGEGEV